MANLLVRNIEEGVVRALKSRAGLHGVSAEAEHRRILEAALLAPRKKSFAQIMGEMPDVGRDSDFERIQNESARDVFD